MIAKPDRSRTRHASPGLADSSHPHRHAHAARPPRSALRAPLRSQAAVSTANATAS